MKGRKRTAKGGSPKGRVFWRDPQAKPLALCYRSCLAAAFLLLLQVSHQAVAQVVATTRLLDPVTPACISSPFGPRILRARPLAGTFHNGIDLPAPAGAPVRAIAPGVVIRVQRRGPGGLEILVQHAGFIGVYSHLGMVAPAIAEGRRVVSGGEKLGVIGHSGLTYGMHLFFAMIVGDRPVDPAPYLGLSLCGAARRTPGDASAADANVPPTRLSTRVR
jgi:murein DD-endopeptidase MepM/ murein hydrolase activator NlpD